MAMVAHGIPYAAQTTFIGNFSDLSNKAHKAIYTPGAAFLNVMAPCPRGWRYPSEKLLEVTKAAVETCVWPLYEVVEGKYILSYKPKNKLPVEDYLKMQGRFAHMAFTELKVLTISFLGGAVARLTATMNTQATRNAGSSS